MCLYLKENRLAPKRASKEITCYKVLEKIGNILVTPYRGILVYGEIIEEEHFQLLPIDGTIHIGVHSFYTKRPALIFWNELNRGFPWRQYIVKKCVIPEGTLYWEGICDELCSEKLILQETIIN